MDGADVSIAPSASDGFWSYARLIRRGSVPVDDCRLLVALLGTAELVDDSIVEAIEDFTAACGKRNSSLALVVAAPIPRAGDPRKVVG